MISIIIPTYKNKRIFLANLSHNLQFFRGHQIIVVNDDPGESIAEDIKKLKDVVLIENEKNLGFAGAADMGVRSATHDDVMLLNSDVLLHDRTYEKAIDELKENPRLFAVSFAQQEKNGTVVGKNRIYWKNGLLLHERVADLTTGKTAWAEGGACMLNKKIYLAVGGFDTLFSPFYWEDIDLSYRAWKDGYEVHFDRDILVEHHHESTIGKYFNHDRIKTIAYRNQFFFIWKNIVDKKLIKSHILRTCRSVLPMLIRDMSYVKGLFLALLKLGEVRDKRKQSYTSLSDQTIINIFAKHYEK